MCEAIFPLVLAGHLVGDWIVQTDWQAANKTTSWVANQAHVLTYHLTMLAFVGWVWHDRRAAVALALSWVTHSVIDRRRPVVWLLGVTRSEHFSGLTWGVLATDQALHIAILVVLVVALG